MEIGEQLRSIGATVVGDRIWVTGFEQANAVFSMNRELQDVRLEYAVTEQEYEETYGLIKEKDNHIYLFPLSAYSIIDIDMLSGLKKRYDFSRLHGIDKQYETIDIKEYQGIFYLIPGYVKYPLLKFDGNKVEECAGWREQMQNLAGNENARIEYQPVLTESILYMLVSGSNKILCTDMETLEVSKYDIPWQSCIFERLEHHLGRFWLLPGGRTEILSLSIEHGIERCYPMPDAFSAVQNHAFSIAYEYKHFIWFSPRMAKEFLILDVDSGKFDTLKLPKELREENVLTGVPNADFGFVQDHYLKLFAYGGRHHCIIDMEKKKFVSIVDSRIKKEDFQKILTDVFASRNFWRGSQETDR